MPLFGTKEIRGGGGGSRQSITGMRLHVLLGEKKKSEQL